MHYCPFHGLFFFFSFSPPEGIILAKGMFTCFSCVTTCWNISDLLCSWHLHSNLYSLLCPETNAKIPALWTRWMARCWKISPPYFVGLSIKIIIFLYNFSIFVNGVLSYREFSGRTQGVCVCVGGWRKCRMVSSLNVKIWKVKINTL